MVCGPGSIEQAHKPNEYVTLEQIAQCEAFMRRLMDRMCKAEVNRQDPKAARKTNKMANESSGKMTGSPYPMKAGRGGCAGRALVPLALLVLSTTASAAYPERPIRLIISSAAGGSPDIVTRILCAELSKQMGQQIVIDNRPGGARP